MASAIKVAFRPFPFLVPPHRMSPSLRCAESYRNEFPLREKSLRSYGEHDGYRSACEYNQGKFKEKFGHL